MKKAAITFLLICFSFFLHAQKKQGKAFIDSLLTELPKAKEDTNKVKVLNSLSRRYYEFDLDQSVKYGKEALALAEKLGYKYGAAKAWNILGGAYYLQGNNPEAMKCNNTSLELYREIGNKKGIAACYLTIGNAYANQDNYTETFKNYFAALKIFEEVKDTEGIVGSYNNIGAIYHSIKNDSDAMKNYLAGMKIVEDKGDKGAIAEFEGNIGNVYSDGGKYPEALKHYTVALDLYQEINQKNGIADCYANIGVVYKAQGNYAEALKSYQYAAKLLEEVGNKYNLCSAFQNIGVVLYKQKKYREAEQYYIKQLNLAKDIGALLQMKEANQHLWSIYETMGDYKKALEYFKAFTENRDSIFNKDNAQKILQAQMQYDFDKKESLAKVEQAKKDTELSLNLKRKNILIYSALSAFALLLVIGTLLFRQNKMHANQQRIELEQKQLRAQMNPHFIFNCLNSIQHFVVAGDVKNANKYLSGFASLMRQTLENSKDGMISLRREIAYLGNYLTLERMRFEDKFTSEIVCADNLDIDSIEIPSMIIQPFIENAIRHGLCYLEDKQGVLTLNFYIRDNHLFCEVDDNGIGRERSRNIKLSSEIVYESQGMELTRQRLALVSKASGSDYKISIIDKKSEQGGSEGTKVILKFPLNT